MKLTYSQGKDFASVPAPVGPYRLPRACSSVVSNWSFCRFRTSSSAAQRTFNWRPGRVYFLTLLEPSRDDRIRALSASLNRSALLRSGYWLCWRRVSGLVSVCFPGAVASVVPGVPGCAPAPTAPGCVSFRVAGVVRAGQAGAGRAQSRCQQVRNASFQGQFGLILRMRSRAWRARRAGMCQTR